MSEMQGHIICGLFDDQEIHHPTVDGINYGTNELRLNPDTISYNNKKKRLWSEV